MSRDGRGTLCRCICAVRVRIFRSPRRDCRRFVGARVRRWRTHRTLCSIASHDCAGRRQTRHTLCTHFSGARASRGDVPFCSWRRKVVPVVPVAAVLRVFPVAAVAAAVLRVLSAEPIAAVAAGVTVAALQGPARYEKAPRAQLHRVDAGVASNLKTARKGSGNRRTEAPCICPWPDRHLNCPCTRGG